MQNVCISIAWTKEGRNKHSKNASQSERFYWAYLSRSLVNVDIKYCSSNSNSGHSFFLVYSYFTLSSWNFLFRNIICVCTNLYFKNTAKTRPILKAIFLKARIEILIINWPLFYQSDGADLRRTYINKPSLSSPERTLVLLKIIKKWVVDLQLFYSMNYSFSWLYSESTSWIRETSWSEVFNVGAFCQRLVGRIGFNNAFSLSILMNFETHC